MQDAPGNILVLAVLATLLTAMIAFLLEQQQLLQDIKPQNRTLAPGKIWLQLIPVFGIFFQFRVVASIADSIHAELTTASEKDMLSGILPEGGRPTYKKGLTFCILSCCTILRIPFVQEIVGVVLLITMVSYWRELRKYRELIRSVSL